jgi:hypothetical protein
MTGKRVKFAWGWSEMNIYDNKGKLLKVGANFDDIQKLCKENGVNFETMTFSCDRRKN